MSASRRITAVLICAVGALTACTGTSSPAPTPSVSSSQPTPTPTPSPAAVTSASPAISSAATSTAVLPTGCSQLLPLGALDRIVGTGLLGQVTYLRAAAVPKSGRTGRVTCGYGTSTAVPSGVVGVPNASPSSSGSEASAQVTVSYITYIDAATAQSRVQTTVEADGASAVVSEARVNGKPAEILLGAKTTELVMADNARTVVVVLAPSVVSPDKAPAALTAIAAVMLQFGRPSPSASPVASSS